MIDLNPKHVAYVAMKGFPRLPTRGCTHKKKVEKDVLLHWQNKQQQNQQLANVVNVAFDVFGSFRGREIESRRGGMERMNCSTINIV